MEITWYGLSCFRITERNRITVVTDPFADNLGLPPLRLRGDVVTVSHDVPGHNAVDAVKGVQHVLTGPGEYEIGGVFLTGMGLHTLEGDVARWNCAFRIDHDDVTVVHLGDLSHVPDQATVESFGQVTVLLLPVGGGNGLRASQAAEVVGLIEPAYVVPMHYSLPGLALPLEPVDRFLKAMGLGAAQTVDTLKVTSSEFPDQAQVVLLAPQGQQG